MKRKMIIMARMLTIKATNMKSLDKLIRKLEKAIPEAAKETVQTACVAMEADSKTYCPVDTGRLRDSINTRIEDNDDNITGIVSTDVEYALT